MSKRTANLSHPFKTKMWQSPWPGSLHQLLETHPTTFLPLVRNANTRDTGVCQPGRAPEDHGKGSICPASAPNVVEVLLW
jgi:hypothetical protein